MKWDDNILANVNLTEYVSSNNYTNVIFKELKDPNMGWAVPFVTGHKYKVNWGYTGLDWD